MKTKKLSIRLFIVMFAVISQIYAIAQTVTDIDGNVYNTVTIGTQTWIQENFKALHYADGTDITGTWIYNNDTNNLSVYGRLYDWDATMHNSTEPGAQGVCPDGWHVPTDAEWTILGNFLGGNSIAGGKMKEEGTTHWWSPNTGAINSSGFTGLPRGEIEGSNFQFLGEYALFWSSTQVGASDTKYRYLAYNSEALSPYTWYKSLGYSVRCVKDTATTGINKIENIKKAHVFPNPANKEITVLLINYSGENIILSVYNSLGNIIKQKKLSRSKTNINISRFPKGIYFLKIKTNDKIIVEKIIKE